MTLETATALSSSEQKTARTGLIEAAADIVTEQGGPGGFVRDLFGRVTPEDLASYDAGRAGRPCSACPCVPFRAAAAGRSGAAASERGRDRARRQSARDDDPRGHQRQPAVPAGFDARRTHRAGPVAASRRPPDPGRGAGCRGRADPRRRRDHRGRPWQPGARELHPHPPRPPRRRQAGERLQDALAAVYRDVALASDDHDAMLARLTDLAANLRPGADPDAGGRDRRSARLPGMAEGRPVPPPRHAAARHRRRGASAGRRIEPRRAARSRRHAPAPGPDAGGLHAGDPRLPRRAAAADHHQGERQVPRPPVGLPRLCRRQAVLRPRQAFGRGADRRACSRPRPTRAPPARCRSCAGRSRPWSSAPGSTRRAMPAAASSRCWRATRATSCSRSTSSGCTGSPSPSPTSPTGRGCACSRVRTGSAASSRSSSTSRRTATIPTVRGRIGAYLAEAYGGRLSAAYPDYPEGPLARIHYIIGLPDQGSPEQRPGAASKPASPPWSGPGATRCAPRPDRDPWAATGRGCWPPATATRSRPPTGTTSSRRSPSPTWRSSTASARRSRGRCISGAGRTTPAAQVRLKVFSRGRRASPCRTGCRRWRTSASGSSTSAPTGSCRRAPTRPRGSGCTTC